MTNPVTRATEPRPVEAYGRAKLDAELLCRAAISRGLDVSVVRPRTILGHGRLGIFGILFDWIADGAVRAGARVAATTSTSSCTPPTWPMPARRAAERAGPAVYNIGAERFGTMREALEALCEHAGTGARVRSLPAGPTAAAMQGQRRCSGRRPFAPYHWIMYGRSMWFDTYPGPRRARVAGTLVERGDAARLLRLVPRPARRRPQRRLGPSPHGESGALRLGQAAALRRLRWSTPRRRPCTNQQSANTSSIRSRRASSSGSSAVPRSTSRA